MTCLHRISLPSALWLALLGAGCAQQAVPAALAPTPPRASDGSTVCEGLIDRFVGLPAMHDSSESPAAPAPLAGRWWVRNCSTSLRGRELHVRLEGPGWYFVDESGPDLSLHQQVPFNLAIEVDGRLDADLSNGVLSLWLVPDREPKVELSASKDLDVRPSSAWGAFLRWMPLVPVRAMAAERFSDAAVSALRIKLRDGATATYDFGSGQGDATLGKLALGQTPQRVFHDHTPWLVNDRLLLGPSAIHVLGPIAPGPTRLDVDVQQGMGITYQAVCDRNLDESYSALAGGHVSEIPSGAVVANGTVSGPGPHTTDFIVPACKFYLVVSAVRGAPTTLAALRVRA
jgi:hypothetical protein